MQVSDLEVGELPQEVAAHLERVARLGQDRIETVHRRKDASTYPAEISVRLLRRPRRFLALVRDLSERRQAERALRESEQRFQLFMDHFPGLAYIKDERLATLFANRGFLRYLGIQPREILGKEGREFFPRQFAEAIAEDDRRVLASGETREFEESFAGRLWATHKFPIPRGDAPPLLGGVTLDISARREAEEALRQSNGLLLEAQRVAHLGAYDLDIPAGLWTGSPVLDEIFGIDAAYRRDVAGWLAIVHPEDREEMGRYLAQHVIAAHLRFDREYRIVRCSDGEQRWVHGRGQLFFDAAGTPVRMVGTIQDISERRQREQEKLELERRLLHAQKLESLGVLAGGIAHDFNNLLMADPRQPGPGPARSCARGVARAPASSWPSGRAPGARGPDAADARLLGPGRVRRRAARPQRAGRGECRAAATCRSPRTRSAGARASRGCQRSQADAAQIRQVIMNLITNAAEAIGDGPARSRSAPVSRDCDAADLSRSRLGRRRLPPGRYVFVEVADTGCRDGQPRRCDRLFDPFFTTKFTGRGLGMSAVLGIVRGHQGAILVNTTVGQGTTIRVLFPLSQALVVSRTIRPLSPPEPSVPDQSRAILVVDDEEAVRRACLRFVARLGYRGMSPPTVKRRWRCSLSTPPRSRACCWIGRCPRWTGCARSRR